MQGMVLFILLLLSEVSFAQAPRFSQYETVPMLLNPALAGTTSDIALNANYRVQRLGQIDYQTGYFSAILPIYQQGQEATQVGGLALSAVHDMAGEMGELKTVDVRIAGAYNLLLNKYNTHIVTFGIQGEYTQTRMDYGVLNWPSQISFGGFDPSKPVSMDQYEERFSYVGITAGAFWMYDPGNNPYKGNRKFKVYGGFSVDNLNKPSRSVVGNPSQVPLLYKIHGGSEHYLNDRVSIAPGFLVLSQQHIVQYTVGTTLKLYREVSTPTNPKLSRMMLQVGSWYRVSDAMVFLIGMGNRQFSAALSLDVSTSRELAAIHHQQSYELSVAYRFLKKNEPKKFSTPLF